MADKPQPVAPGPVAATTSGSMGPPPPKKRRPEVPKFVIATLMKPEEFEKQKMAGNVDTTGVAQVAPVKTEAATSLSATAAAAASGSLAATTSADARVEPDGDAAAGAKKSEAEAVKGEIEQLRSELGGKGAGGQVEVAAAGGEGATPGASSPVAPPAGGPGGPETAAAPGGAPVAAAADGSDKPAVPAPTPQSSDQHAAPGASATPPQPAPAATEEDPSSNNAAAKTPKAEGAVDSLTAGGPKVGSKHALSSVVETGLDPTKVGLQAREGTRKAIALRLEPLRDGLPAFERVLTEGNQNVVIGSNRKLCDLAVVDEAVSKKHCMLGLIGVHGELAMSITDTSTNGTYINGKRVQTKGKRFRIRSGDTLQVKDARLEEDFGWKIDFGNTVSFFERA